MKFIIKGWRNNQQENQLHLCIKGDGTTVRNQYMSLLITVTLKVFR